MELIPINNLQTKLPHKLAYSLSRPKCFTSYRKNNRNVLQIEIQIRKERDDSVTYIWRKKLSSQACNLPFFPVSWKIES